MQYLGQYVVGVLGLVEGTGDGRTSGGHLLRPGHPLSDSSL